MNLGKRTAFTGYFMLSAITALLVVLSITETYRHVPFLSFFKLAAAAGIAGSVLLEGKRIFSEYLSRPCSASDGLQAAAVVIGGVLTFILQKEMGLHAVLASGLVGAAAGLWWKKYAAAVFCGSFAGMASPVVYGVVPCILISSFIAGILFVITQDLFEGAGGKLGTIAFTGCLITAWMFQYDTLSDTVFGWDVGWLILIYSVAGAVGTYILNHRYRFGAVLASACIGIITGIVLPLVHGYTDGSMFAVMAFCASFAGMSSVKRIQSVWEMTAAGVLCGLLFIYTSPYLVGAGGKLGTIAFAAVLAVSGWRCVYQKYYAAVKKSRKLKNFTL